MALRTLMRPTRHAPSALVSGWLPRGFMSTRPITDLVERFVPGDWPEHPNYWAVTADYATGRRHVWGREDADPAPVGPRRRRRRARSRASTTRSRSTAGATSTAASARRRTSI
jgi:hypothetical protein